MLTQRRWTVPILLAILVLLGATTAAAYLVDVAEPPADTVDAEVRVAAGAPLRVAFVGDSLDYGLYATQPDRGFHQLMVQAWRAHGPVEDTPLDSLGGTVQNALGNTDIPKDQDLVVVELGTNDVARASHRTFRQDYETLLGRIRDASPDAALVCIGPWRPGDSASRFDTIIKDLCEAQKGVFRSISDISENASMKGPADLPTFGGASDDFHPNDRGHRAIADRMLGAVVVQRDS